MGTPGRRLFTHEEALAALIAERVVELSGVVFGAQVIEAPRSVSRDGSRAPANATLPTPTHPVVTV